MHFHETNLLLHEFLFLMFYKNNSFILKIVNKLHNCHILNLLCAFVLSSSDNLKDNCISCIYYLNLYAMSYGLSSNYTLN